MNGPKHACDSDDPMKIRDGLPLLISDNRAIRLEPVTLASKGDHGFDEVWLQRLIFENPGCIPIAQIEPGLGELVSVCCELPIERGAIDNLMVTAAGDIVIAEVKLWRNPEARRQVVAQALDYASCLFRSSYQDLDAAVQKADFCGRKKPASLYETVANLPDAPEEKNFVDAVATNLRRGRIVVLVVSDGIRTGVEQLFADLQLHAGFHFTFALIELPVFRLPAPSTDRLVYPGVLAKTTMIERGIVRIEGEEIRVHPVPESPSAKSDNSISREKFFEAMAAIDGSLPAKITAFLDRLSSAKVRPEFKRSMNLKWDHPNGKSINVGYIETAGFVWTDTANWTAPLELSHAYVEDLAERWHAQVNRTSRKENWFITFNGKAPRILDVADKLDEWASAIETFLDKVSQTEFATEP